MTQDEFRKLHVGAKVELLDRDGQRTGTVCTVLGVSRVAIRVDAQDHIPGRKTSMTIDNPARVGFPTERNRHEEQENAR